MRARKPFVPSRRAALMLLPALALVAALSLSVRGQSIADDAPVAPEHREAAPVVTPAPEVQADAAPVAPAPASESTGASETAAVPGDSSAPEAPAATEAAAAHDHKPTVNSLSLLDLFLSGGWLMWPLAFCSLVEVALIVDRFAGLRHKLVIPPGFAEELEQSLGRSGDDMVAARAYCTSQDSPMSRVILAGLRKVPRGEDAVESAMEDAGATEVARLRGNVRNLHAISVIAPMMGLLGTVQGMIEAFHVAATQGLGQGEQMAVGIYHLLVTTFSGLAIAVPALIFYFYFQSRIEALVAAMNHVSERFLERAFGSHATAHPPHAPAPGRAELLRPAASAVTPARGGAA